MGGVELVGGETAGRSLATVDSGGTLSFTPTGAGPHDVTGFKTGVLTIPASGLILVDAFAGYVAGSATPAAVCLLVYEAAVVGGVEQSFGVSPIAGSVRNITTAATGGPMRAARPLTRTPGNQYVYKLSLYRSSGSGNPSISDLGGLGFTSLNVFAR